MRRWTSVIVRKIFCLQSPPVTRWKRRNHGFVIQNVEPKPTHHDPVRLRHDPYSLVAPDLSRLRGNLIGLLGSAHPDLNEVARYYFLHPSKQLRSLVILLFSRAMNGLGENWNAKRRAAENEADTSLAEELDRPLKQPDVLNNWHPSMPNDAASFESVFELRPTGLHHPPSLPAPPPTWMTPHIISSPVVLPTQIRLAQIVEMIHIASCLHDEVFDPSACEPDPPGGFGNKLSILGGDFLLGRASAALSRLGESEVVELVGCVISNLVEGEMLRMKSVYTPGLGQLGGPTTLEEAWTSYFKKTYLKTASLLAKSARASVILGGCGAGEVWKNVAYMYGRNLGIAYQLMQDSLVYEEGTSLEPGLATGPVLYAAEEHSELQQLIQRNFMQEGDIELAISFVRRSSGVQRTRALAQSYADKAQDALHLLPESDAKIALDMLPDCVMNRTL
ncbi:trans-hexaprenyltranstransferase [Tricholoma matsutake]|nr:trans-hexaprenyltranstransferase [Tricholoma matsutake 945]